MFTDFLKFWKKSSLLKEATDELVLRIERFKNGVIYQTACQPSAEGNYEDKG